VDDSRTMRDMLLLALQDAGYRVVQTVDGVHGLEVLHQERPDIVITDINMPRMDGFGFIEGMRSNPDYSCVPVLVLTTESDAARPAGSSSPSTPYVWWTPSAALPLNRADPKAPPSHE